MVYLLSAAVMAAIAHDIRKRFKWGRDKAYRSSRSDRRWATSSKMPKGSGRYAVFLSMIRLKSHHFLKNRNGKTGSGKSGHIKNRETNHISIIERTKSNKATSGSINSGLSSLTRGSHSVKQSSCGHKTPTAASLMLTRRDQSHRQREGRRYCAARTW